MLEPPAFRAYSLEMFTLRPTLLAAILFLPGVLMAQYTNPYSGTTYNNNFSRNIAMFSSMQQNLLTQTISIQASTNAQARALGVDQPAAANPPRAVPQVAHLPIQATDFLPVVKGHPVVDRYLLTLPLTNEQRASLRQSIDATFANVATNVRANNLAASMGMAIGTSIYAVNGAIISDADSDRLIFSLNDTIARAPEFAKMSRAQKQDASDALILVSSLILSFRQAGESDPQLKQQSILLGQGLLQQLTGSQTGK